MTRRSVGAVTPKLTPPRSRSRSRAVPVKVIAGCRASGRAPATTAGASTPRPCVPEVWATIWPAPSAPVAARSATSPASTSSGTERTTNRAWAATWSAGRTRVSGRRGVALGAATTGDPAAANAAPRVAPTRPTPMIPTGALMTIQSSTGGTGRQKYASNVLTADRTCGILHGPHLLDMSVQVVLDQGLRLVDHVSVTIRV